MRRLLFGLVVLTLLLVGASGYADLKSAEDATLDDAARAEAPGDFISLTHGTTHYELTGPTSGRLVVLVHGFSVPYYIWDSTAVALTGSGYRVLRYDLFGRGFSDRPKETYDGAFYVEQLSALLDSLGIIESVDLLGLSFGGPVVSQFAVHHPDRVRSITLIDPMSERPDVPPLLRIPVVGNWIWKVSVVPGMAAGQMTDFLHPERYPTWIDQYLPQMRYKGFGRALLSTLVEASQIDFDDLYTKVAATGIPVMLIWGKQDQTVPYEKSDVPLRNIPSIEFVTVDSAGHLPHIEQAAFVNARLMSFLGATRNSAQR
jgi:pimeloyl-ACP methyl ester carboxylesterase